MIQIPLILSSLLLTTLVYGQKKVSMSKWQDKPIVVDGELEEWSNGLSPMKEGIYYDKTTKLAYAVSNDEKNIYLFFRIVDQTMQMKVLKTGLLVSIDTTGKMKKSPSINYPIMQAEFERPTSKPDMDEIQRQYEEKIQEMRLVGFKQGNGISLLQNPNGVQAKLKWGKNKDIIYEFSIPFASFWKERIGEEDVSKTFSLNVSFAAMERPNAGTGTRPSGGGRPSSGGRPSWVGGDSSDFQVLFQEQRFRHRFTLAFHDS